MSYYGVQVTLKLKAESILFLVNKLTSFKVLNGIFIPPFLQCFGAQTQVTQTTVGSQIHEPRETAQCLLVLNTFK